MNVLEHPDFLADYERLAQVTLDPARHTASDARAHCEQVAQRVEALARRHGCTEAQRARLVTLARVHDIGKLAGHARPAASLSRLEGYGVDDPALLALVKAHDLNLPWWQSWRRGEAPTDRAWSRLARKVDLRQLALFMIADRVDAPGGWRANAPLMWFLAEARRRGRLDLELEAIDDPATDDGPPPVVEHCAGALLVRHDEGPPQILLIRVRAQAWELPKGHLEAGERAEDAAARELREETGLDVPVQLYARIGSRRHSFVRDLRRIDKHVEYFTFECDEAPRFGPRPRGTRALRWVSAAELPSVPLVSEELRSLIAEAHALVAAHREGPSCAP